MTVFDALSLDNKAFRGYVTWSGILVMKMLLMALLTSFWRFRNNAVENAEDIRTGTKDEIKKDEDVEKSRRAHLNDLENIPAFIIAAFFYVISEPHVEVAMWLIRIGVIARLIHTVVSLYLYKV